MNSKKAKDIIKDLRKDDKVIKNPENKDKDNNDKSKTNKSKDIKDKDKKINKINPKKCKCYFYYYKSEPNNRPPPHDLRTQLQKNFCRIYKNEKIKSITGPGMFESDEPQGTDIKLKYHNYRIVFDNKEDIVKYIKECGFPEQKFDNKMFNWMRNIEQQEFGDIDLGM